MARIRRLVAVAGAAALAGSLMGGPARAESPEVFFGSAAGKALDLDLVVLDKQATFGVSSAKADSTGLAQAVGAGQINSAAKNFQVRQEADAATADPDVKARRCAQPVDSGVDDPTGTAPTPPEVHNVVDIGLVCSSASAAKGDGNPSAGAEGSVAEVGVNAQFAIDALEANGVPDLEIGEQVSDLLDTVCGELDQACPATTTVKDLVTSILDTQILEAEMGKSTSSVVADVAKVTSTATASGGTIKILPLPDVDGLSSTEPIVTIKVSDAKTTAVYDRVTGKATATFDPALVRIRFNPSVTDALSQEVQALLTTANDTLAEATEGAAPTAPAVTVPNELAVTPGDPKFAAIACTDDPSSICLFELELLETRIRAGNGRVVTAPDGSVTAVADGVRVEALKGLDEATSEHDLTVVEGDAVTLSLAHAEAAVGGRPANPVRPAQVTTDTNDSPGEELTRSGGPLPPLELPRTGGFPWLPVLGTGVLSLAALLRRATVKATR